MWRRASLYIYALAAVIYLTLPFAWVAAVSFMPERVEGQSADGGAAIARQFPRAIANSLIIGTAVMLLNLTCGSLAAYALSRLPFRGNLLLLLFYLGSRSVPGVAIMIPMYLLMRSYGLLDTHLSVILSHTTFTLPFTIWILKGYFQTVPLDLERAARVDGCTPLGALLRVFLPVTTPGLVAVGIFAFIASWGEFLFALLFTTTIASRPVTVLASDFAQELQVPFTVIAAGGVLVILLPLVLSFLFQRLIIQGIGGSVTG